MTGFLSALTQSLILSIMALGIYISYKVLDFPDLSVDGSFSLVGAIIAFSLTNNLSQFQDPTLATCPSVTVRENLSLALNKGDILNLKKCLRHKTEVMEDLLEDISLN